jgi:hypothetical protein
VGIAGGFTPTERLASARPDVLLDSLAELPDVFQRWRDATTRITALEAKPSSP